MNTCISLESHSLDLVVFRVAAECRVSPMSYPLACWCKKLSDLHYSVQHYLAALAASMPEIPVIVFLCIFVTFALTNGRVR